jgi:eukaryotic-like serine/threonine-protein kinase
MTGLHLSHYAIESELGRGGMGIVFRAKDTKLNRTVALKVLPAGALASEDDRARFRREAQASAQLNHPNVCHVYQVDEAQPLTADGKPVEGQTEPRLFIAMEFIEGETLHDYVKNGPLKLQEAVNIAGQIAEGLKEAHAKDIVHRDIKSANIMLTEGGVAKVLDFGLAKTNQSTMLTRMGSTLGTVAYMSPEQARGQEVDGRSDLYSLGTVLYEMVAGRLPYSGDYEQAVLYGILNEAPEPLTAVRTGVPMQLEWLVNKLLAKEAEYRYQSAAGLLADLKSLDLSGSGQTQRSMPAMTQAGAIAEPSRRAVLPMWGWGLVGAGVLIGLAGGWLLGAGNSGSNDTKAVVRTALDVTVSPDPPLALAVSANAQYLAYLDDGGVWARDLQTQEAWLIPETNGVRAIRFSPDGNWLLLRAFRRIRRVLLRGGRPIDVVPTNSPYSRAEWVDQSSIVFADDGRIYSYDLGTGAKVEIAGSDSSSGSVYTLDEPYVTADGRTLLAMTRSEASNALGVFDYPGGSLRGTYETAGDWPIYLDSGHLLFFLGDELIAQPFDLGAVRTTGPPVPVGKGPVGWGWDISADGHVFAADWPFGSRQGGRRIERQTWEGEAEFLPPSIAFYDDFDVHPDGNRLAIEVNDAEDDIWIVDTFSGVRNRLTFGGTASDPFWHPSGDSVVFARHMDDLGQILIKASDGSGEPRTLWSETGVRISYPRSDPGFETIAFGRSVRAGSQEIWLLDTNTGEARPGIGEGTSTPAFSPNGRYLLYGTSDGEGQRVWMQTTSGQGGRWDISRGAGRDGRWSAQGDAMFYRWSNQLFRVSFEERDGSVVLGNPEAVLTFDTRLLDYGILPDGSGILRNRQGMAEGSQPIQYSEDVAIIFNWIEELAAIAPPSQ